MSSHHLKPSIIENRRRIMKINMLKKKKKKKEQNLHLAGKSFACYPSCGEILISSLLVPEKFCLFILNSIRYIFTNHGLFILNSISYIFTNHD